MKTLLLTFFFTLTAFGSNPIVCEREAMDFGGLNKISAECLRLAQDSSDLIKSYQQGRVTFTAFRNMLLIQRKTSKDGEVVIKQQTLAGRDTQITKIIALEVSHDLQEVYLLNENEDNRNILIFKTDRSGNVKPRTIVSTELKSAKGISLNDEGNRLYVLTEDGLISYKSDANSRSTLPSKKPVAGARGSHESFKDTDAVLVLKNMVVTLDRKKALIRAFDPELKTELWKMTAEDTKLSRPKDLFYDPNKSRIIITDFAGTKMGFKVK